MSTELQTLQWQFELTMQVAQVHLPTLTDEAVLWEPTPYSWNVRRAEDGIWRPDFSEVEPTPLPTVTIGWLTWHIQWWWSGALVALQGQPPLSHEQVHWQGSAAAVVAQIESLAAQWREALANLTDDDLERPFTYPWQEPQPLRLALAWLNSELMKNVAELGYLRLLYEASKAGRGT